MKGELRHRVLLVLMWMMLSCGLLSCVGSPPEGRAGTDLSVDRLAADWLAEPGQVIQLDPQHSWVQVQAYRAGRLARFGHNHLLEVRDLNGELRRLDSGAGLAWLHFRPQQMRVDDRAARVRAGDAFTKMPDAKAIEGTRGNLLGPEVLDVAAWPKVRLLARVDALATGSVTAELWIDLRGVSRRYQVPVTIDVTADQIRVAGSLALNQSDFGIVPFSVMAGALQVKDRLQVEFQVVGRNSESALW